MPTSVMALPEVPARGRGIAMFDSITDLIATFDSCAAWVSVGENFEFAAAPGIRHCPEKWTEDGAVTFSVIRVSGRHGDVLNRVTFVNFPGMDVLGALARAYA